jgi:glycine cleavage system H protein
VIPPELRYTGEHEWVRVTDQGTVVFGITDYAQDALGDIVFVDLPAVDVSISEGASCGEIESTKSVSEVYAPVSGTVIARNESLEDSPDTVNTDPYGAGWLLEVRPAEGTDIESLLDAAAYAALTSSN